jgi:RNA polymerase sigma-70 factor (ECF subfamily)
VDPALFRGPNEEWPGDWKNWTQYPRAFPETPESSLLATELVDVAKAELDRLPDRQRMVVTLRDMLGFDSSEVCELLDISVANQRVLLHRGRAALRLGLESYLGVGP